MPLDGQTINRNDIKHVEVLNPKRGARALYGRASWYPYYAGFSPAFAQTIVESLRLGGNSRIMDPWNGSGTTTSAALTAGYTTLGFDLNPVMVIAARARLLSPLSMESLPPLMAEICKVAERDEPPTISRVDPLSVWITPPSAKAFRRVEAAVQHLLVDGEVYQFLVDSGHQDHLSDLAAFFYVALFRSVRKLLASFFSSNPTWVKRPHSDKARHQIGIRDVLKTFKEEVAQMVTSLALEPCDRSPGTAYLARAASEELPVEDESVDLILTSPPYCTRIDYAVATSLELAVLGYDELNGFDKLRRKLLGTSSVAETAGAAKPEWGRTCNNFLQRLEGHPSKASNGYYLKNHVQYFAGLANSLKEVARVLRPGGLLAAVVQDSYYKEIHNDLPTIVIDMASELDCELVRRVDFPHRRTMSAIHPGTKLYRSRPSATESVLFLRRNEGMQ